MSSNLQSQETRTAPPPVLDQNKKMSFKMIEMFVKELVVERDFKVNDSGDIIMIRHLPVSKCTVQLLRQICVRFKVSGYKNQNKESTLGLLKNLVIRETLKNKMYNEDDDSDSYFSVSSQEGTPAAAPEPCRRTLSKESSAEKKDASTDSSTNGGDDNTRQDAEEDKPEEVYQVGGDNMLPLDEEDDDHGSDDADDNDENEEEGNGIGLSHKAEEEEEIERHCTRCSDVYQHILSPDQCIHVPEESLSCDGPWSPPNQG